MTSVCVCVFHKEGTVSSLKKKKQSLTSRVLTVEDNVIQKKRDSQTWKSFKSSAGGGIKMVLRKLLKATVDF